MTTRHKIIVSPITRVTLVGLALAGAPVRADVVGGHGPHAASESLIEVLLPGGERQRALYDRPARPRATLVMLPGGTGDIGIERDGDLRHDKNFVVRTRDLWLAKGYAVLIPDTVDRLNLRGLRASPAYGAFVKQLVEVAYGKLERPVVLLGTSQGTIAAVNGATRTPQAGPLAALVLTESVSRAGRKSTETVFDANPAAVRVPTLIVANRSDGCDVAPPGAAGQVAAAFTRASLVKVLTVSGGVTRSDDPCSSQTPHGYDGIEQTVVDGIGRWLAALPGLRE